MARLRTQMQAITLLAAAALLIGCGGEKDKGGAGGTDDGRPRIASLDPERGPVGSDVVIHGANFGEKLAQNTVRFNNTVASTLEVGPDRKWVRTRVPTGATTGKLTMQVDLGTGPESIEGPIFTVTDDKPKPSLASLSPSAATKGFTEQKVVLGGGGFVEGSRVLFNGKEIAARRTASTAMEITLSGDDAPTTGSYEIQVINAPPGGGESEKLTFKVVEGIQFLEARAIRLDQVLMRFDRPVRINSAGGAFEFTPSLRERRGREQIHAVQGDPNSLIVETSRSQGPNVDYTVQISGSLVSTEGGKLVGETTRSFRSFRYPPVRIASYGAAGCDASTLNEPISISFAGDTGYVTENGGNQVQLFKVGPETATFEGFLGNDGDGSGLHVGAATAAGCPGDAPEIEEALAGPRGAVGIDDAGGVYVSNSRGSGIIHLDGAGVWTEFVPGTGWTSSVMLGLFDGRVAYAADDGKLHLVTASSKVETTYGMAGSGAGAFGFAIGSGGTPAMAVSASGEFAYVTEPGNHRVQRVKDPFTSTPRFAGVIGLGADRFDASLESFPIPGPGMLRAEFTSPTGIVVLSDGMLLVADEAVRSQSTTDRGRIQKFEASGLFREESYLDYRPGGMAVDQDGNLWITDPDNHRIHRYKL